MRGFGIMNTYNYFEEVNPNFRNSKFKITDRKDPDMISESLITDLVNAFLNNRKTPSGKTLKVASINQTKDENRRWYAKVQVFEEKEYNSTFGLTSDYIGASINWALASGVSNEEILKHISISRTLEGHLLFPTWYSTMNEKSWEVWPEGISINMAKGGSTGYYDRIDYTLLAIKNWYSSISVGNKLFDVIEKNRIWFELFCDFPNYVEFFKLESLLNKDGDIVDLTSYNPDNRTYDNVIRNDLDDSKIKLPQDNMLYERYIAGCNFFILSRKI